MKTKIWEGETLHYIDRELNQLLTRGVVKTIVSMSLTSVEDKSGQMRSYSAILIYK